MLFLRSEKKWTVGLTLVPHEEAELLPIPLHYKLITISDVLFRVAQDQTVLYIPRLTHALVLESLVQCFNQIRTDGIVLFSGVVAAL